MQIAIVYLFFDSSHINLSFFTVLLFVKMLDR